MLTLKEVLDLKVGESALYKGRAAKVKWKDVVHYLLAKSWRDDKGTVHPDVYFHSDSVCFEHEDGTNFTLTTSRTFPAKVKMSEFTTN